MAKMKDLDDTIKQSLNNDETLRVAKRQRLQDIAADVLLTDPDEKMRNILRWMEQLDNAVKFDHKNFVDSLREVKKLLRHRDLKVSEKTRTTMLAKSGAV